MSDQSAFETAVQKALRRCEEADIKGEEYLDEFKAQAKKVIDALVQSYERRGIAPEVAVILAEKRFREMSGKENLKLSIDMIRFAPHQRVWVDNAIKALFEEARKERGIA